MAVTTVSFPSSPTVNQVYTVGSTSWRWNGSNWLSITPTAQLSVKDFGATGDGTTDDTVAIQAAVDAAVGGNTVFFPAGTYLISSAIELHDKISLVGDAQYKSIIKTTNTSLKAMVDITSAFKFISPISNYEFPDISISTDQSMSFVGQAIRIQSLGTTPTKVFNLIASRRGTQTWATSYSNPSWQVTTLATTITSSTAVITLTDASQFAFSGTIVIDDEEITYTAKSGNNLIGITRGANSTTAASHTSGVQVSEKVKVGDTFIAAYVYKSSLPGSPSTYQAYVDTTDSNKLKYWNGSAWVTVGSVGAATLGTANLRRCESTNYEQQIKNLRFESENTISVTSVTSTAINCSSTTGLVPNQLVWFLYSYYKSSDSTEFIAANQRYYIKEILTSTTFTISDSSTPNATTGANDATAKTLYNASAVSTTGRGAPVVIVGKGTTWVARTRFALKRGRFENISVGCKYGLNFSNYPEECVIDGIYAADKTGQYETLLHIRGNANIIDNVKKDDTGNALFTAGLTTEPYIIVDGDTDTVGGPNLWTNILVQGASIDNKPALKITAAGNEFVNFYTELYYSHVKTKPLAAAIIIDGVTSSGDVKFSGNLTGIGSRQKMAVTNSSLVRIESLDLYTPSSTDYTDSGAIDNYIIVDTNSYVTIDSVYANRSQNVMPAYRGNIKVNKVINSKKTADSLSIPATYQRLSDSSFTTGNLLKNPGFRAGTYGWKFGVGVNTYTDPGVMFKSISNTNNVLTYIWSNYSTTNRLYQDITVTDDMIGKPFTFSSLVNLTPRKIDPFVGSINRTTNPKLVTLSSAVSTSLLFNGDRIVIPGAGVNGTDLFTYFNTGQGTTTLTLTGSLDSVAITSVNGEFSCTSILDNYQYGYKNRVMTVGMAVNITNSGSGSITAGTYYIIATNGSTTFQLSATQGGSNISTTIGGTTGLTFDCPESASATTVSSVNVMLVPWTSKINPWFKGCGVLGGVDPVTTSTALTTYNYATNIDYFLSGVTITGTGGQFNCTTSTSPLSVGMVVRITGTNSGTGSITSPLYSNAGGQYYIIETNGYSTFTLSSSLGGSAITTSVGTNGTTTGLTFNVCGVTGWQLLSQTVTPTSTGTLEVGFMVNGNLRQFKVAECNFNQGDMGVQNQSSVGSIDITDKTIAYDTAAPTTGTWTVGSRVFNSAPTAGSVKSWVCVVAGSPGTWEADYTLPAATTSTLGGVIVPAVATSGITNSSGTIGLATASTAQLGGVKVDGSTITIANGVISSTGGGGGGSYTLPIATTTILGGIRLTSGGGLAMGGVDNSYLYVEAPTWIGGNSGNDTNLAIGMDAFLNIESANASYNLAIGFEALSALTTADRNVAIGYRAATIDEGSSDTVSIGNQALSLSTTIDNSDSVSIGSYANLWGLGLGNIAIGSYALSSTWNGDTSYGNYNIAIGHYALSGTPNGDDNIAIGRESFYYGDQNSANNIMIGAETGQSISSGNNNVFIGHQAGKYIAGASGTVIIGGYTPASGASLPTGISSSPSDTIILSSGTGVIKTVYNEYGAMGFGDTTAIDYGTAGYVLKSAGNAAKPYWAASSGGGSGTITSMSVVTANGFAGTVANPTTTPAITLTTSITGVLKGNGTAISAATAGTDYQAPITLTTTGTSGAATFTNNTLNIPQYGGGVNLSSVIGTLAVANGGTGTTTGSITGTGVLTFAAGAGNNNVILTPTGTGTVDVSSKRISNLALPTADSDAATKIYVDGVTGGVKVQTPVAAATAGNINTTTVAAYNGTAGTFTAVSSNTPISIDGQTTTINVVGTRILIKDQNTSTQNGIYKCTTAAATGFAQVWTRDTDVLTTAGNYYFVQSGTKNVNSAWVLITPATLIFVQHSASSTTTGIGLSRTGTQIRLTTSTSTSGQVLTSNGSEVEPSWVSPPLSYSRVTVSGTASNLAANSTATVEITGYKSYMLFKAAISNPSWVRIYVSAAARTADLATNRTQNTDPTTSGVIAEFITTVDNQEVIIAPAVFGWNNETTPAANIPIAVTNNGTAAQSITTTLTVIKTEN